MASSFSSSRSRSSGKTSINSSRSSSSAHTYSTKATSHSETRPVVRRYSTCPGKFGRPVDGIFTFDEGDDARSSTETYASTVASDEDLADQLQYEVPSVRPNTYDTEAIPTTPPEFAKLFPTTRRILIQHDDATSDGNMNLRLDAEAQTPSGEKLKMTLFHLRMTNLHEREMSLRRYCRDSGREICSAKKKYAKPVPDSLRRRRPTPVQRSLSSALQSMGIKASKTSPPADSGYDSDEVDNLENELRSFTLTSDVKATLPTNVIRLEFSNYAQVELHRCRDARTHAKKYDFEYWGEPYSWCRQVGHDDGEVIYSYELVNQNTKACVAYIMPDKLDRQQARLEERQGGWIPPSSMRLTDKNISQDLGDVIVASGLVVLTDDSIKRRWHNSHTARVDVPVEGSENWISPDKIVDAVFPRRKLATH